MKHLNVVQQTWVDKTLASLSIEERIGQLLVPMMTQHSIGALSPDEWVAKFAVGGGHIFGGQASETREFVEKAQTGAKVPLLISGDLDKGGGDRIREGTRFQYQMAVGAANDEELAYALGQAIATECRAVGFNWAFTPIVDVVGHPNYQRLVAALGADPELVARLAVAEIRGIQDHGMAACAKHFPGDGFDDLDQHVATIVNPLSREEWNRRSAVPFRAAIRAGVWSIMNSCLALPSVDGTPGNMPKPSIISRDLTEGILRREFGFEGVIVSDALNMGGLANQLPVPERYIRAFEAGNDVLLFVSRLETTIPFLCDCVRSGRITEERLEKSVRRILTMKARLGLHEGSAATNTVLPDPESATAAGRLAGASITLVQDRTKSLPIARESRIAHVVITNRTDEFDPSKFEECLEQRGCQVSRFLHPAPEQMYDSVAAGAFDVVITSFYFPPQWGWCTVRAHGAGMRSLLSCYWLAHRSVKPVFVSFVGPMHLRELPHLDPFIVTFGEAPCVQKALAEMLLGERPFRGRLPISFLD